MAVGCYDVSLQELIVIDDLLSALVGIEGRYISISQMVGMDDRIFFHVDASLDLALHELAKRFFPLCESYLLIEKFVELRSQFKNGIVNHAFSAALRMFLLDYQAMVAQLEHQFRLGRLSIQGLWFYCQPMMRSMKALSSVTEKATKHNLMGSAVLNLLQSEEKAWAGDNEARSLLDKMTQSANDAYLGILERWVYDGVIHDPYGEFFISENKFLSKESLMHDYEAKYWEQSYQLNDGIPGFLTNISGMILTTGKYLNVMRECGHNVQIPTSETLKLVRFGTNHHYLECIRNAYNFASNELLILIKEKGDFLVHFMDISGEDLTKKADEISVEKLQSLLDLALRATTDTDLCHKDLTCFVERCSLLKSISTMKDIHVKIVLDDDPDEQNSLTGLETFCLGYTIQWPLSIVISRKAVTKYQLIFRFLFHCKHIHRQLCVAWQVLQGVRAFNIRRTSFLRLSLLCRSMLKFINSLLHYLTFEVIEPNWHTMSTRLDTCKCIDEIIQHHDFFLDKCLRECLLLFPELIKKVEKLKSLCAQYALAVGRLVSSHLENTISTMTEKSTREKPQLQLLTLHATLAAQSTLKLEKEFNSELETMGSLLSNSSQAEPYLTHLAQWILGGGHEK